ncbi:Putative acetyltransferase [Mycobacteroides abscessus subsp. abscessus]|uniref:Acetyltransferase n=1 Tax=Mycobacteroides abscessus TaxID=36809 RepID=A0AB33T8B6_9MYCO|nr:hypothetical protein [Mycobacteroides abscessus]SHO91253.1 Putative acetyltransferase [Mycobacteroides abscessus subsp. abscessus]MBE5464872.1 hypothetical protein [Mycobacteroides abscessus]CPT40432.1 Putative acetyltransferase [Mycobacteroides abscessus]CPT51970.1 Putative acetyltransferase [Mycobacteroides abscessus]
MTREIRDIDSASEALAHRVIATAFAEDPVLRWVNSDPRRDQAIFRGVALALHGSGQGEYLLYEDGVAVGAAHWDPPSWEPPAAQRLRAIPPLLGGIRLGLARVLRWRAPPRPSALRTLTGISRPSAPLFPAGGSAPHSSNIRSIRSRDPRIWRAPISATTPSTNVSASRWSRR